MGDHGFDKKDVEFSLYNAEPCSEFGGRRYVLPGPSMESPRNLRLSLI